VIFLIISKKITFANARKAHWDSIEKVLTAMTKYRNGPQLKICDWIFSRPY